MLLGVVLLVSVAHADPEPLEDHVRWFFVLGVGFGGESRLGDVAPWRGNAWTFKVGERLGSRLQLVETLNALGPGSFSPDPAVTEEQDTLTLALRWTLREPSRYTTGESSLAIFRHASLYLEAGAGVNLRSRYSITASDTTTRPIAAVTFGALFWSRRSWAFGEELREQVAPYGAGVQRSWDGLLLLQVTN